jgi:large subunit ribosomal protein L11
MLGGSVKQRVKEIVGTCVSMGVNVEGRNPREVSVAIGNGEFDDQLKEK